MCGCFMRCNISSSSYTICSLPFTFFFRMILTATLPSGQSASRTMPYVPAPSVFPKRYRDLRLWSQHGIVCTGYVSYALAVIAVGLAVQLVEHICHCKEELVCDNACRTIRKRVLLIVGKLLAARQLLRRREAECQTEVRCLSGAYSLVGSVRGRYSAGGCNCAC